MARTVHIVHAPEDLAAAQALAGAMEVEGRAVSAMSAAEAGAGTGARCVVALWSDAASRLGEPFFTAMIAALSEDALVFAAMDRTRAPFGFRDHTPVRLGGLEGLGAAEAAPGRISGLGQLDRKVNAVLGRPRFALSDAAASAVGSARSFGALVFAVSTLAAAGLSAKAVDELGLPALGLGGGDRMDELEGDFREALDQLDDLDGGASAAACEESLRGAQAACREASSSADLARAALARLQAGGPAPDPAEAEAAYERAERERAAAEARAERFCTEATRREVDEGACAAARLTSQEDDLRALANARIFPHGSSFAAREVVQVRSLSCPEIYRINERDWYDLVVQDAYAPMEPRAAVLAYRERFGAAPNADDTSAFDRCTQLGEAIMNQRGAVEQACAPRTITGPRAPAECERAQAALEAAREAEQAAEIALGEAYQTPAPDAGALAQAEAAAARADAAQARACADETLEGKNAPACQRRDRDAARAALALAEAQSAATALCREAERVNTAAAQRRCAAAREALSQRGHGIEASFSLRRADMYGILSTLRGVTLWGWLEEALPAPVEPYAVYVAIALSFVAGWLLNRLLSGLLRLFGARTRAPKRKLIDTPASDVFVSYARKNADRVGSIADMIERLGLKVWIDRTGIAAGEAWAAKIVQAVRESDRFSLMGSKAAFASDNVYRELHVAAYLNKPIKPFVLDGAEPPDAFLYFMAGTNFVDLKGRSERELRELLQAALARR
ncbi:MAG: toll/interleukin-1 receptor domain-containing protein [Oceanicaulis sp.]